MKRKKHSYKDLVRIACELESMVVWGLKFLRASGDGVMVRTTTTPSKSGPPKVKWHKGIHWTYWYADGAEMMGRYKVDRELIGLSTKEYNKVLKQRANKSKPCPLAGAEID